MTAQEFIDTVVVHYAGAPNEEVLTLGHWHSPPWSAPVQHFAPAIRITAGELRSMATERARLMAEQARAMRKAAI